MRCHTLCLWSTCTFSSILLLLQLLLALWLEFAEDENTLSPPTTSKPYSLNEVNDVVLVWWTPFTGNNGFFLECGHFRCFVTQDRRFRFHPKFQMFLFYGSNLEILDLPLPRKSDIWSLLHEESPKNVPFLSHGKGISLFNYTSTFSRFSDVPLTLQYVHSIAYVTDKRYVVPLEMKNKLLDHLSPVLYVQSDCDTPLDRDRFVGNLMKFVPIDSYGACLQNKQLPLSLTDPMESMNSEEFLHFAAQYKFTIAFENAICDDYITEKLWRPLAVGSVPIYMGSPTFQDWLPNPNSAIFASNFSSPKELAEFIWELNADDQKYSTFLLHKKGVITNQRFLTEMQSRAWGLSEDSNYHFVDHFECQMCLQAHLNENGTKKSKVAREEDYSCPKPISSITGHEDSSNPWLHLWQHGKCVASVLEEYIQKGLSFIDQTVFNIEVANRLKKGTCEFSQSV